MAQLPLTETIYQHLDKHEGVFFPQRDRGLKVTTPVEDTDPVADQHPIYRPLNPAKEGAIQFYRFEGRVVSFRGR